MKSHLLSFILLVLFFPAAIKAQVLISDFGGSLSDYGVSSNWTFNPQAGNASLSGPNSTPERIFQDFFSVGGSAIDISGLDFLELRVESVTDFTGADGTFIVGLSSGASGTAIATFNWADFNGVNNTAIAPLTAFGTFWDPSFVFIFEIAAGGSADPIDVNLVSLTAVPEPNSALLVALGSIGFLTLRRHINVSHLKKMKHINANL